MPTFSRFKKPLLFLTLVVFMVAGGGVFWFSREKSYGIVTRGTGTTDTLPQKTPTPAKEFSGKSVTFFYPGNFHEVSNSVPIKKPFLERFTALKDGSASSQMIALVVQDLNGSSLTEYSSYAFRSMHPKEYQEEKIEVNATRVTLFTKATPVYEIGAFFERKGKVVSLVISSPLGLERVREELLSILSTFSWKE